MGQGEAGEIHLRQSGAVNVINIWLSLWFFLITLSFLESKLIKGFEFFYGHVLVIVDCRLLCGTALSRQCTKAIYLCSNSSTLNLKSWQKEKFEYGVH